MPLSVAAGALILVTDNHAQRPFSRDERRWVSASSKLANRYFKFGTDNDMERVRNYPKHAAHPDPAVKLPRPRSSAPPRRNDDGTFSVARTAMFAIGCVQAQRCHRPLPASPKPQKSACDWRFVL